MAEHEVLLEYGATLARIGRNEEAIKQFQKSDRIFPTVAARTGIGQAFLELGNRDEAQRAFEFALAPGMSPDPENFRKSVESIARIALDKGDANKCVGLLTNMMKNMPASEMKSSTTYLMQRGLVGLGETKRAKKWAELTDIKRKEEKTRQNLQQLVRDSPNNFYSQIFRAFQFVEKKNIATARSILETIEPQQDDPPFLVQLRKSLDGKSPLPSLSKFPSAVNQ